MSKYCIVFISILFVNIVNAQESWGLEKCIAYALENNLDVRQAGYNLDNAQTDVYEAKNRFLPSLNGNAQYGYNFGQRIDPFSNQFANSAVNTANFNLAANWTIYSGLSNLNQFMQSEFSQTSREYAQKNTEYLTSLAVTTSYLDILYNLEILSVANKQLEITTLQVERTRKLVDAGSNALGSLYDIEAQLSQEELAQVNADNKVILSYLSLKQLLRLPGNFEMEVEIPQQIDSTSWVLPKSLDAVIQTAYDNYPSIKSSEYALLSAEKQISISSSARIPTLSLSASLGTGFSGNSKDVISTTLNGTNNIGFVESTSQVVVSPNYTQETQVQPFTEQVSSNFNQSIGISLSIPVFNRMTTKSNVARARVNYSIQETALEREKQKVRQDIETAFTDAVAAYKSYMATQKGLKSFNEAFKYAQKRLDVGVINAVDYNVAKTNLYKAQSDLVRAKYGYLFKMKILDFYQGKPLYL